MSITESESYHKDLEKQTVGDLLKGINQEDKSVADAVEASLPQIEQLTIATVNRMKLGGRLFYIGAGTSGRLGILDASECPPTFGVDHNTVIGIIAGGDSAIRKAVEFAEDNEQQAWEDLKAFDITSKDVLIGIAASGTTPYVIGGIKKAKEEGILTGCICCNPGSPLASACECPVEVVVGPEFVTGSTRMKAGTAQKMVLNMISTTVMIQLGKVEGNRMVDMQLSNDKLVARGTKMIQDALNIETSEAHELLLQHGSVRQAITNYKKK
ncbi:N-acetylmuramic acid 6-phosphate etherase [Marivirga atlantica]|jgi:N-acetylmuramic acid 6-phosphate etherase|uniref:N-acetylmuramic acid 6-phosphate etherase n=1 Tax=Marivirga atlantica TaxID=1548457 RepID=A0A937A5C4_9BACT|nr:N-acetylmuramic acid 6-phosphate etherase [Marivirga atlantica]MBL0763927.1 N-acetylmuramic acid 6-phosphate etherase [Marivirga atlantica]